MKIKENFVNSAKKLYQLGFAHVFGSSVINKAISLITNMAIVRFMSKSEYGVYSFAYNIIAIIMIFSDLGTRMARLQYCCETENESEHNAITRFLYKVGSISNLIFIVVTIIYALFLPLSIPEGKISLLLLSGMLLTQFIYDQTVYTFRINKSNKKFSYLSNINSASYFIFGCLGAFLLGSVGTILGRYLSFILTIYIGIVIWKGSGLKRDSDNSDVVLDGDKKKKIILYGLLIVLTNAVSSAFGYLGSYLIGFITHDELLLADYSVAAKIPTALAFIPTACITFIYPYFAQNQKNKAWIRKKLLLVVLAMMGLNAVITVGGYVTAPYIIRFIFGAEYESCIPIFRVLVISYFISGSFRVIFGNVLAMLHMVKVNFWTSSVECILTIILNVIFIKKYGSIGAAYVTLIMSIIASIISLICIEVWLRIKKERGIPS